jgi:P-type Mg2+ transporter
MTFAIVLIGLWLPFSPLASYFGLRALSPPYYLWLVAILAGYCVLTSFMKRLYVHRYGWQ